MMLNLGNFIADNVTHRAESMFAADIENNRETLSKEIEGKSLLVIGGAGSIVALKECMFRKNIELIR